MLLKLFYKDHKKILYIIINNMMEKDFQSMKQLIQNTIYILQMNFISKLLVEYRLNPEKIEDWTTTTVNNGYLHGDDE